MESLRTLVDALKTTTYELLAVLLPGVIVAHFLARTLAVSVPGDTAGLLVAGYATGLALQGLGDPLFKVPGSAWRWLRKQLEKEWVPRWLRLAKAEPPLWIVMRQRALDYIRERRGKDFPDDAALDVCLTCVEGRRQVYDKFISLRDTARGLAVATIVVSVAILWPQWDAWQWTQRAWGLAACLGVFLCFVQRYRRFHPLAQQAVFGQFEALRLDPPPSPGAAVPPKEDP